jgi:hypothetical protein
MNDIDRAGILLLKRLADKAVEPLTGIPEKTVAELRQEIGELLLEAVNYFIARRTVYGAENFEDKPE